MNLLRSGPQGDAPGPLNGAGWLALALGLLVTVGWLVNLESLIRVAPDLPSMKFESAVCLAMLGGAAVLARRGHSRIVLGLCLASGLATGLTLLLHVYVDVAASALLVGNQESLTTPSPAMTAAALTLAAAGLALLEHGRGAVTARATAVLGVLVAWFGLHGLVELPLRAAARLPAADAATVGLQSSIVLMALGGALFSTALDFAARAGIPETNIRPASRWTLRTQRDWLPLMAFLAMLTLPLNIQRMLAEQQTEGGVAGSLPLMVAAIGAVAAKFVAMATHLALSARWQSHLAQRSNAAARRAREALRASHQRFEAVTRATTDAVWDWDVVTDALWWNEGYASLFGHAIDERDRSLDTWIRNIHPADRERVLAGLRAALAGTATHWSERYRFARHDGGWTDVADRGVIIRQHGRALRMIGGMSDVTEQNATRRILRDRERFFEVSLELLAIARVDGTLLQVNPAFERVLGWSQAELLAQPFFALLHPDDLSVTRAVLGRLAKGENVRNFAVRSRCRSGAYLWFEWSVSPEPDGLLYCAGHEVTERKIGEARLRRMIVRLEAGTRELQDLGQVAAHDLAEPLQRLRTDLATLGTRVTRDGDTTLIETFRHAERAMARLQAMLGELLAYSRVGTDGRQFEPVDLDGVIDAVLEDLGEPIKHSGSHIEKSRLPVINADIAQMRLLFHNLIGHGLRVHRPGIAPRIQISANAIPPDIEGAEEMVSIVVEASALVAAHLQRERRAVPLQMGPERGKRRASGISLAIARRIVARHQGSLAVHSDPSAGARFDVRLPRALSLMRL